MDSSPTYAPSAPRKSYPITIPLSGSSQWMIGTLIICAFVYYFIGIDEGATSIFGNTLMIHEFVHDARHFLGFPCH